MRTALLRTAARLAWLHAYSRAGGTPVPRDRPAVRSRRPDPDRVLLVGNGAAAGRGVVTHELALAGQLARAVTRRTGRPCDVDFVGDEAMLLAAAPSWIGDRSLDTVDAVVLAVGLTDALRLTPEHDWRGGLARLLELVLDRTSPDVEVLVLGVEPLLGAPAPPHPLLRMALRHGERLDAVTEDLTLRTDRTAFDRLPAEGRTIADAVLYAAWAEHLAGAVGAMTDAARRSPYRVAGPMDLAPERAVRPALPPAAVGELHALVQRAKAEMHADLAWISLASGDRFVITASSSEAGPVSVPADLSFCRVVVAQERTLVVPNRSRDERFRDSPLLDALHLESYAGHPLRGDDGGVIGTFCVASVLPRPAAAYPGATVRRFARSAEVELRRGLRAIDAAQPSPAASSSR